MMNCSPCACDECPDEYALCNEHEECRSRLECMAETNCQGVDQCESSCADRAPGTVPLPPLTTGPSAEEILEALGSCLAASQCAACP
jgi:hypothetical protein